MNPRLSEQSVAQPLARVLLVEDNQTDALILRRFLERSGLVHVDHVQDGLEGYRVCRATPPDALILDLELPTLRGEDVLRLLRASPQHRHIPVVIISHLPEAKRREMELLQIGANRYIEKPFVEEELVEAVRSVLHRHASGDTIVTRPSGDQAVAKGALALLSETAAEPQNFKGYRLIEMIGAGGMGMVYRAEQINLARTVALKVLLDRHWGNKDLRERFRREAIIMAQINHPNIVQIYDVGFTDWTYFFSMEYVPGRSLWEAIRHADLSGDLCRRVIDQGGAAIAHLHSKGIIHRDLKPQNILIRADGEVKITDFGISEARLPIDETMGGKEMLNFVGTWGYMAPEVQETGVATVASDIYAFGRTVWRLFTHPREERYDLSLAELRPDFPPEFCDAVAQCLDPDPRYRFETMDEARQALLSALG